MRPISKSSSMVPFLGIMNEETTMLDENSTGKGSQRAMALQSPVKGSALLEDDEYGEHVAASSPSGNTVSAHDFHKRRDSDAASSVHEHGRNTLVKEAPSFLIGYNVIILLFFLGLATGVINGCIAWLVKLLSSLQVRILTAGTVGPFYFLLTTTFLVALSAFIIQKGGMKATYGTGMPEVKALLVSDFHLSEFPNIVSLQIFCLRVSSLILGTGSGLSIGMAAPLVHASLCTAYCVMRSVPIFRELMDNPAMLKQIFAAAAAVGMSTVFNAPVGGLLFSIEVTSTYYLISNYWRSFMAATTGAVMYNVFLIARENDGRIFQVDTVTNPYAKWEFLMFIMLGGVCGILAYIYLRLHQAYYLSIRKFLVDYPVPTAAAAGAFTAILIFAIGAHSNGGVSETIIVKDLFSGGEISEMHDRSGVSRIGGLFASLFVRVMLTMLGTTLRISAGVFLPMFTIGALLGRIFGQIVANASHGANIYVDGYAMVGAAAFLSGTTHTISAAVIVIEMTGEIDMLLPCLIGAVIACGITKSRTLSLYDQGMVNKGLESFELLLEATGGFNFAQDVMDDQVISVTRSCTVSDLFMLMSNATQSTFPVIDSAESCKLVGSLERRDVYLFLRDHFSKQDVASYVITQLPADVFAEERFQLRAKKVVEHESWLRSHSADIPGANIARRLFPSSYALQSMDVSTSSVDSGWGGHGVGEAPSAPKDSPTPNPLQKKAGGARGNSEDQQALAGHEALIETLLAESVDLQHSPQLPLNGFPFTAHRQSTMDQLYVLFEMVKVKVVFVVAEDKSLEGMISKDLLLNSLKKKVN